MNEQLNLENDCSTAKPKRPKTMSEAALAANRANAQKSTGPRTAAGKARSASNSFQHGLYAMRNFSHLQGHPDLVTTTIHNLLEEYQPVTPTEHMLVHQLVHLQLRFMQIENFFNQYLLEGKHDAPDRAYLAVLRELDRIPARMLKIIKAIKDLTAERANREIEPIEDPPPVETAEEYAASHNLPYRPTAPEISQSASEYIYQEFCRRLNIDPNNPPTQDEPIEPPDNSIL